ncbi:DUF3592 domain-containing protein [Streptomyces sp. RG80]|uniref:DUF3592 domain-containing protein n=1 Tax=Streptomyces sp. RG80 TaxID=3157340 RepID=UPI00338FABA1
MAEKIRNAVLCAAGMCFALAALSFGLVLTLDTLAARRAFDGAGEVTAVVTRTEYAKPKLKVDAEAIEVTLTNGSGTAATIDDVTTAPDGLTPGDRVTVLHDPARPGHALFPSQLGWSALMFPGLSFAVLGLIQTLVVAGVATRAVLVRRTRGGRLGEMRGREHPEQRREDHHGRTRR